jgi:hypothetical protein
MSGTEDDLQYRLHELESIPLDELRSLYKDVVNDLCLIKLEFEDF